MKVTTEDLGSRQVMLTIQVGEERVDRTLRGVARRISKQYNIPGFRRGRAPFNVILQRFGREALLHEALDDLGEDVVREALEAEKLDPYDAASLEDVQLEPLTLKLRVPLKPAVELGNYRELRVEPPVVVVNDADVDAELERMRQANAILEPAGDRLAQMGDWISVDVSADFGDESLLREEAHGMVLDPEDEQFEAGFAEQVVGMKVDEEKQFELILSDKWDETKAGQEASFSVTLREIKNRTVPDLDDDLARTVGDFDTLEELRQDIVGQFEADEQRQADDQYTEEVIEALVAEATIEYPPDLIEDQIDDMVEDLERRLEAQGMSVDDFLKLSGQTEEAFRETMRPQAETIARRGLVLGALARQEELDVEGAEIDEYISVLSAGWGDSADEARQALSAPDNVRSIASSLLTNKVVQRLVAIAKGEAPALEEVDEEPEEAPDEAESLAAEPAESGAEEAPDEEPESVPVEAREKSNIGNDTVLETD